jgi:tRNA-binding protein
MSTITYDDFARVDIRAGTIIEAAPLEGARKPAYRLLIDFGPEIGQRKCSAQLTVHYQPGDLVGRSRRARSASSCPKS